MSLIDSASFSGGLTLRATLRSSMFASPVASIVI
jgi:hypothetical protein